jgi:hypothetical protein
VIIFQIAIKTQCATAKACLMRVSAVLQGWVGQTTEQLNPRSVWLRVCDHLKYILTAIGPFKPSLLSIIKPFTSTNHGF